MITIRECLAKFHSKESAAAIKKLLTSYGVSLDIGVSASLILPVKIKGTGFFKKIVLVETSLLEIAAYLSDTLAMVKFINCGATQDQKTLNKALRIAVKKKNQDLTHLLIDRGARLPRDNPKNLLFYFACLDNHVHSVQDKIILEERIDQVYDFITEARIRKIPAKKIDDNEMPEISHIDHLKALARNSPF